MTIMAGWHFQCASTTCLPFVTLTASDVRQCQINCLNQIECQAASFQQSTYTCELFGYIPNQNSYISAYVDTVTMLVIDGTRIPPG